jgi:hypothetical protein
VSDDLRRAPWRGRRNPVAGHCYVASEVLYHLLGGAAAGWVPQHLRHEGAPHWFVRNLRTGEVLDATAAQFRRPPPYRRARGKGFLTRTPSARARRVLARMRAAVDMVYAPC